MNDTVIRPPVAVPARASVRSSRASLPLLVGLEMRKSLSTRSGKALAGASILLAPVALAVASLSAETIGSAAGPIAVMGMLTAFVLLSFGVLSTAGEWSHRTVQTTFLLVSQRGRVLAAKATSVALLGAVFAAISTALSAGVLAVAMNGMPWTGATQALVTAVGAGAAFAVVGAGVGAVVGNTPAALTGLYLVILGAMPVLETVKPVLAEKIDPAGSVMNLAQGMNETTSALVITGWVIVSVAAGAVISRRRAVQ